MAWVNYVPFERAKAMTDAVNNARTIAEHRDADHRLQGYQQRCKEMGQMWPCVELDLADETDRPLCCGVWLDWVESDGE